MDTDDDR
jgi:hypothetical protein